MNFASGAKIYQALNSLASCKQARYKWVGTYSGCIFGTHSQAKIGRAIDCDMHGVMTLTARCSASLVAKTPILANTKTPTLAKKEADSCKYKHTFMQIQAQIWTYYNSIKSNQESIAGISSETLSKPFKLE